MWSHGADEWDDVWAEFDARAGGPPMPAPQALPWYLDPGYGAEPVLPRPVNPARGPLLTMMTIVLVMLSAMLNIEFVPARSGPPGGASVVEGQASRPVPSGLVVTIGGRAEAAEAPVIETAPGPLLMLPPPPWVPTEAEALSAPAAVEPAARHRAIRASARAAARSATAAPPALGPIGAVPSEARQKAAQAARPAPRQADAGPQCAPRLAVLPTPAEARPATQQRADSTQATAIGPGPYLLASWRV